MKHAGFSLIEMLVVLTVLAVAAAVSVPTFVYRRTPDLTAKALVRLLREARVDSLASAKAVTVKFDLAERKITPDRGHGPLAFAPSTSVRLTFGREKPSGQDTLDAGTIVFYPDGRSTGGIIEVSNGNSNAYKVEVRWQDGAAELEKH